MTLARPLKSEHNAKLLATETARITERVALIACHRALEPIPGPSEHCDKMRDAGAGVTKDIYQRLRCHRAGCATDEQGKSDRVNYSNDDVNRKYSAQAG